LVSIRDPLAADESSGANPQRANDTTILTQIGYDSSGRASGVTLPAPTLATDPRPAHTYAYTSGAETRMSVAGAAPTTGYARRVLFDGAGRTTDDYDAAGIDTHLTRDAQDAVTSTTQFYGTSSAL